MLGTSFNIKARGNQVEVACVTGKVSVKSNQIDHEPVILLAGLASTVEQKSVPSQPYEFDINQKIGWTRGEFYFHTVPLNEVFAEIARQFNTNIIVKANIENLSFTGRVELSEINVALEIVCLSSGLNYRRVNQSTYIISQ